jgi:hypothetical protein
LKELYRENDGNFFVTSPFEYYPEGYKVNGLTYVWDYDYTELPDEEDLGRINFQLDEIQKKLEYDQVAVTRTVKDESGQLIEETITDMTIILKDYIIPFDLNTPLAPTSIFNINLEPSDFIEEGSELETILESLNRRGYLTMGAGQHAYVPPIIHEMGMSIDVVLFTGSNFNEVKGKITNIVYAYLKEHTEFAKPIFRSKVESLIQELPEVAGLNLNFKPKQNSFSGLKIDEHEWLGTKAGNYINQTGLTLDGFESTLTYDYQEGTVLELIDETLSFTVGNQAVIAEQIKKYYTTKLAFKDPITETFVARTDITEEEINKFTGYIWSTAMNEVYLSLFDLYKEQKADGFHVQANEIFNVIEALKGWFFTTGKLQFKHTELITNMTEDVSNSLGNYKIYILEYVKLVRNILADLTSARLIDTNGNISNYSNENEIVQFNIATSDITVTVGT